MESGDASLVDVAKRLNVASRVAVFTGAGMSAESGIPTFRGTGGLWEKYPPGLYGNVPGLFCASIFCPWNVSAFFRDAIETFASAEPNAGHMSLAQLERMVPSLTVVTQNIDNLHTDAGNTSVLEVHGSCYRFRCLSCGRLTNLEREDLRSIGTRLARSCLLWSVFRKKVLPKCEHCQGTSRPDIVFFGEGLDDAVWRSAESAIEQSDVVLCIGTSGSVFPAASLPRMASRDAMVVEINPEPVMHAQVRLKGSASTMLPKLVAEVTALREDANVHGGGVSLAGL